MHKIAYRLTGAVAVASAGGFLLRWLQNLQIIDEQTGLAIRGATISYVLAFAIVLVAAALAVAVLFLRRYYELPAEPERAMATGMPLETILGYIPAGLLGLSGLIQLIQGSGTLPRITALLAVAGGLGVLLIHRNIKKPARNAQRLTGSVLLIAFGAFWLITVYKSGASDPVIWRFAVEILASCAALLAYFYVAGYFFGQPSQFRGLFFAELGVFLCVTSAIDEHTLGDSLCYIAMALLLLYWGYLITRNLQSPTPKEEQEAAQDEQTEQDVNVEESDEDPS